MNSYIGGLNYIREYRHEHDNNDTMYMHSKYENGRLFVKSASIENDPLKWIRTTKYTNENTQYLWVYGQEKPLKLDIKKELQNNNGTMKVEKCLFNVPNKELDGPDLKTW